MPPARYDRIPATAESPRENSTYAQGIEQRIEIDDTKTRRNQKQLKRRGSLGLSQRSGSYDSEGNEQDFRYESEDANDDVEKNRLPFRSQRSNVSEGGDNDDADSFPYPSITASFSNSFDLEDDDDDDVLEANLKRYNLDFTTTERGASLSEGSFPRTTNSNRYIRAANFLWYSFQSVRQQARQRRADLLLQQSDRNWRQSLKICIMTNCDATDSGILLVVAIMVVWILVLVFVSEFRRMGIVLGILLFVLRVGTRPMYHCFLRQRQKQWARAQQTGSGGEEDRISGLSDGNLEMHAIQRDGSHANRQHATSVGSDPTIAAI